MVARILAYMIYFSPYVFCICLLAEYVLTLVNIKREKKLEEERRQRQNERNEVQIRGKEKYLILYFISLCNS